MKIGDAKPIYYANRKELVEQMRSLSKQKEEAEKKYKAIGDGTFSEQAATLELSLNATTKAFEENQKVIDSIMDQCVAVANMESAKQQGEAMEKYAEDVGKIMTVFRRMANGDIVPQTDEKKLLEYDDKMYQMAKNMQTMAMQMKKERKKYKSLWEEEEEKQNNPDPMDVADNTEFSGELPDIEIPDIPTETSEE